MIKKLIIVASLFFAVTPSYAKDYLISADAQRISKSSTIITIDDVSTCFDARRKLVDNLSAIDKKYKTSYPYLTIPNVDSTFDTKWYNMESRDLSVLEYKLGEIQFNPANNKYYYFQCMPMDRQMFAEVLTIEQVQAEIDKHYAIYLDKENKKSSTVNNILGFK